MARLSKRSGRRGVVGLAAVGMVAGLASSTVGMGTAAAAPVKYEYSVTGSTHIAKNNSDVQLGPGNFAADLDVSTGKFTGEFSLPKTSNKFKAFGMIDVSAGVEIVQVKPVTGTLKGGKASATLTTDIRLSDIKIAGVPADVGNNCKGVQPTTIELKSGANFDPLKGGVLKGNYDLPEFAESCGALTPLINMLVPGPGNTIQIKLAAKS